MEESGFFTNTAANSLRVNGSHANSYHDFKLLYSSKKGFCRIFLASRLGRRYIVKCLRDEYIGNVVAETALKKEFDIGAMQNSTFVVRTFDFIVLPDLGNCIILEYCPGKTLREILDSGKLIDEQEVDLIVHALANGIADIHASGIIHRDIKPENIIVAFSNGSVKIIDFGFADSLSFIYFHDPAGTPGYSPSLNMNDEESSCYLDLYAMGVVLNELSRKVVPSWVNQLTELSERLIKGAVKTSSGILNIYDSLKTQPRKAYRRLIISGIIFLTILISYFFTSILLYKHNESKISNDIVTAIDDDSKHEKDLSDTISEYSVPVSENANRPEKEIAKSQSNLAVETSNNVNVNDMTDKPDKTSEWSDIMIPPEERVKNEYGVSMAEAKYLGIFRQNKFDYYVVQTTDNIMTEAVVILQSEAPYQKRIDAYNLHESENLVVEKVMDKVRMKFPDDNLVRARGLAIQRWRYLHSSQSPLLPPKAE